MKLESSCHLKRPEENVLLNNTLLKNESNVELAVESHFCPVFPDFQ